jgi:hypothetical protein
MSTASCKSTNIFANPPGLPDFIGTTYQNGKDIPNDRKIYQMAIKFNKQL